MRVSFAYSLCLFGLIGCQSAVVTEDAADGAPVPNAIETPIQSFQQLTLDEFVGMGFTLEAADLGEGEYGLYLHVHQPAAAEIDKERLDVGFSLWTNEEQFVYATPKVHLNRGPFLLREGYILRVDVSSQKKALELEPGIGYTFDIDPARHL